MSKRQISHLLLGEKKFYAFQCYLIKCHKYMLLHRKRKNVKLHLCYYKALHINEDPMAINLKYNIQMSI